MRRSLLSLLASLAVLPLGWPHHLLLGVAASAGRPLVVIHVVPHLWGYVEQAHAGALARRYEAHPLAF